MAEEDGERVRMPDATRALFLNASALAYQRSGLFLDVRTPPQLGDVMVDVTLHERRTNCASVLSILNAFTFGLVPAWDRREWTLTTVTRDSDYKELCRFEASEAVSTWCQLLLFAVFPFAQPQRVAADCVYDLNRAAIAHAYGRGVY